MLTQISVDVVPVEPLTLNQWKYPPFSGFYDGMVGIAAHTTWSQREFRHRHVDLGTGVFRRQVRSHFSSVRSIYTCRQAWNSLVTWFCQYLDRISIQSLLEHDFKPTRTFIFAYGIDEESTGTHVSWLVCIQDVKSLALY